MGEYERLNKMLAGLEIEKSAIEEKSDKTDEEYERLIDLYQEIGEVKGALLEMADIDGLDDPYEAFDGYDAWYEDEMLTTSDWDRR